jgi:membrane associated rhomboid family serine protease
VFPLKDDNPTHRVPVVTIVLLLLNVGAFLFVQPEGQELLGQTEPGQVAAREAGRFHFETAAIPCEVVQGRPLTVEEVRATTVEGNPEACTASPGTEPVFPGKQVWLAVLFSMFLHGGLFHLGGNMLFLWVFGNNVEDHLGHARYLVFYLLAGVVATGAHIAIQPDSTIPLIGASGAVAGVMGAYLVWFPRAPVLTAFFFILIFFRRIQAKWLLGFWFVSQFFINPDAGVAWMAHVGGFVFGALIGLVVRASRAVQRATWTPDHRDDMARGWDPTGGVGWSSPPTERRFGGRRY